MLTSCTREEDAQVVLGRIEADYWREQNLGVTRDVGGTLASAITAFRDARTMLVPRWQVSIRTALRQLEESLGADMQVTRITRSHLEAHLAEGLQTRSPSTMRQYMSVARSLFQYLEEEGWVRISPMRKLKLPQPAARHDDYLPPELVGPVLDACWHVAPSFAPIATAICLGSFRKGEVVNLRRCDLDLVERWTYVNDYQGDDYAAAWSPKTECSRRMVPLHPQVAEMLACI